MKYKGFNKDHKERFLMDIQLRVEKVRRLDALMGLVCEATEVFLKLDKTKSELTTIENRLANKLLIFLTVLALIVWLILNTTDETVVNIANYFLVFLIGRYVFLYINAMIQKQKIRQINQSIFQLKLQWLASGGNKSGLSQLEKICMYSNSNYSLDREAFEAELENGVDRKIIHIKNLSSGVYD